MLRSRLLQRKHPLECFHGDLRRQDHQNAFAGKEPLQYRAREGSHDDDKVRQRRAAAHRRRLARYTHRRPYYTHHAWQHVNNVTNVKCIMEFDNV